MGEKKKKPQKLKARLPRGFVDRSPDDIRATDAMVAQMKSNGAEVVMEPTDVFWGERFARVRDPFGHEWGITTPLHDMTPAEIQEAAAKLFESMGD